MTIKTPGPHVNDPYFEYSHGRSWAPHKDNDRLTVLEKENAELKAKLEAFESSKIYSAVLSLAEEKFKDFILISGVYDNDISNQVGKTIAADLADVMLNEFKISFKKD